MSIANFLYQNKTELKVFFAVWLCLFFIFSPISVGLYLTPKIERQEARAWLANIITDAAKWVWDGLVWVWEKTEKWAVAAWQWAKENIWRLLKEAALAALKVLLHKILAMVTNSIIKWIQSDFNGQPGFITDWRSYLNKAANAAAGRFLNSLAGVNLCSAFKPHIRLTLSLPIPKFDEGAACTLDGILANVNATIDDFYNDFSKGGWKAWDSMAQPNNNAFGAYLMALDAKYALEFAETQKVEKESKSGFKSTKKCLSASTPYKYTGTTYEASTVKCDGNKAKLKSSGAIIGSCSATNTSTVDPNSADCSSSITTAPDGTVEFTTNFATIAPMQTLQTEISNLMGTGSGATFTPYIMAITNALITKLADKSMKGLLEAVVQKDAESGTEPSYDRATFQSEVSGVQGQSKEYEEIMTDTAETEKVTTNLDAIKSEDIVATATNNYNNIASKISTIKSKQLSIITDKWAVGSWGTEAVATPTISTTTEIRYCVVSGNPSSTNCNIVTTAPTPTNMTHYTVTTTTVITNYSVSHSRVGSANITKTEVSIIDSRTNDPNNFDIDGNRINNYDSTLPISYSLNSPPNPTDGKYKCQSDYSPSTIICQIDIDNISPSSSFYAAQSSQLTNIPALISNTKSAITNFVASAETYSAEFQKEPSSCSNSGSTCSIAKTATNTLRGTVISSLQTLTGDTSSTTIKDLNIILSKIVKDTSAVSSTSIIVTITAPDGTESKEDAETYYQKYLNNVNSIYNSL